MRALSRAAMAADSWAVPPLAWLRIRRPVWSVTAGLAVSVARTAAAAPSWLPSARTT